MTKNIIGGSGDSLPFYFDENPVDDEKVIGRTASEVLTSNSSSSIRNDHKKPNKCHQCDYQTSHKGNLKQYVQAKHEGIKYPCQQCDYQATQSSNLQLHIRSKHEGIKYPCQQCDYQGNYPSCLNAHIKSKH